MPSNPPTPLLSVVLPCYNEARNLGDRYAAVKEDVDLELIMVDNGSKDDTPAVMAALVANHPFIRCVRVVQNQGYGDGIRQGLLAARGTWLAWSHADLQTDPADVIRAFRILHAQSAPERVLQRNLDQSAGDHTGVRLKKPRSLSAAVELDSS